MWKRTTGFAKLAEWNGRELMEFLYLSVSRRKVTRAKRVDMRQRTARTPSQTIAKCLSSSENRICLPHLGEFDFLRESVKKIKMERWSTWSRIEDTYFGTHSPVLFT